MPENVYEPLRDASISFVHQTTNYGPGTSCDLGVVYAGGVKQELFRTIADFDVSDLAGETIVSARFERNVFDVVGVGGFAAQIHRCLRPGDWVENQVTWLQYKTGSSWTNAGGDYSNNDPPPLIYAEAESVGLHAAGGAGYLVEDAIAERSGIVSVVMRMAVEDPEDHHKVSWFSRETASEANRWRLVVEHGDVTEQDGGRRLPSGGEARAGRGARPATPAGGAGPAGAARPAGEVRA